MKTVIIWKISIFTQFKNRFKEHYRTNLSWFTFLCSEKKFNIQDWVVAPEPEPGRWENSTTVWDSCQRVWKWQQHALHED